jgi:hypothetical protein
MKSFAQQTIGDRIIEKKIIWNILRKRVKVDWNCGGMRIGNISRDWEHFILFLPSTLLCED